MTIGNSSIGGLTLGACVFYYRLFYGQVLGISGFFSKTLTPLEKSDKQISANLFIGGLVASSLIVGSVSVPMIELPLSRMALAGLLGTDLWNLICLVGFGTKLGSGCTSGHGLCGLSRMSPRSWISVPLFMFSGMVVRMLTMDSYFTRDSPPFSFDVSSTGLFALALVVSIIPVTYQLSKTLKKAHKGLTVQQTLSPFFGLVFGTALIVSGMTQNQKVFDFLSFPTLFLTAPSGFVPRFDPSLALVQLEINFQNRSWVLECYRTFWFIII